MKPLKLSTNTNLLGEDMKQSKAFDNLKKRDHSASFDGLGTWLDQNHKKPNTMKNIYKIAASFIFATLILIACTVPVEQEEEIGYMIKGMAAPDAISLKSKLAEVPGLDPSQVSVHQVLHEEIGKGKAEKRTEVVMVLPEANYQAAQDKRDALSAVFDFQSIEILPIEEKVERTFFDAALHTLELKVDKTMSEEKVSARINVFLHENSSAKGDAKILKDENGNRFVVLEVGLDKNSAYEVKKSIEELTNDIGPEGNKFIHEDGSEQKVIEIKKQDPEKL
ncbi:MAG: hypothetical protein JJ971_03720 [Balneolaceae bacterium]|nr:hypothetical protein [Balneolaceae bacterium]MBO6545481.1 hypothetical protein [Balneolaceae bacterium]MBO6646877.1 hypothetical protein [Balneolaceae bacterium]